MKPGVGLRGGEGGALNFWVTNLWGHRVGWIEERSDDQLLPEGLCEQK